MVKKFLKSKSKRMPAKKRYKIEKKVRDHNRKLKKLDKAKVKSKKTKLITVPGDCPFKEKILEEAMALREKIKAAKESRREEINVLRKEKRAKLVAIKRGLISSPTPTGATTITKTGVLKLNGVESASDGSAVKPRGLSFEDLRKKAEESGYLFEKIEQQKTQKDPSLKAFYREFQKVIEDSDVVIEVLDARDPLGTRSSEAEEAVRSHTDKKLIMVLNKCDLIPVENLQNWITYLKQTAGCVVLPFKANTQKQKNRLGSVGVVNTKTQAAMETKKSIGVSDLLGFLGTLARGEAGGLTIGVIGMPNVGKSSLINSLKRSRACNVGAKPGITRTNQLVHLDSKLRLIDSPGVCFTKEKGSEAMSVETILSRVPRTTLMLQYGIQDFTTQDEFLLQISRKYGQLKRGGVHDPNAAEKKIIHDWHTGVIKFFTEPPVLGSTTTASAVLDTLSAPFSLDNFKPAGSSQADVDMDDEDEDDIEMDDDDEPVEVDSGRVTRSGASRKKVTFGVDTDFLETKEKKKQQAAFHLTTAPPKRNVLGVVATKKSLMKKTQEI